MAKTLFGCGSGTCMGTYKAGHVAAPLHMTSLTQRLTTYQQDPGRDCKAAGFLGVIEGGGARVQHVFVGLGHTKHLGSFYL